ncbi:hypothetical protein [Paenarthrobacter sp. C1]|uniref:hypothetical protein n=1 Tax=Paenarthrobacter sp. C1 TaxID=3400220 RepID=UPI003BF595E4
MCCSAGGSAGRRGVGLGAGLGVRVGVRAGRGLLAARIDAGELGVSGGVLLLGRVVADVLGDLAAGRRSWLVMLSSVPGWPSLTVSPRLRAAYTSGVTSSQHSSPT